jgi:hypothetical protein
LAKALARSEKATMSNFQKLVEDRIAKTGESWSTAARNVRARAGQQPPSTPALAATETPVLGPLEEVLRSLRARSAFGVVVERSTWRGRASADPRAAFAPPDPNAGGPCAKSGGVEMQITRQQEALLLAAGGADSAEIQMIRSFFDAIGGTFTAQCQNCHRWILCGTEEREGACVCGQRHRVVFDLTKTEHAMLRISAHGPRCMDCGKLFRMTEWVGPREVWRHPNAWQAQCDACFTQKSQTNQAEPIMYEVEANIIVAALEKQVPGRASAVSGPGPNATVRYYVEGTPIVFNASLFDGRIVSKAVTEPAGGILWGVKENPLSEDGARRAAAQMIEWLSTQIDVHALEAAFNAYPIVALRWALHQVGKHPLRGDEKSYDAVTNHGKIVNGQPVAGVSIRRGNVGYHFRITEVNGEIFAWDEVSMSTTSFASFVQAMRALLSQR